MTNSPEKFQSPTAADHAAIADVIRAETLAFQSEDFEAWKECWVQDGRTHDIGVSPTAGLSVVEGWNSISAQMQHVFTIIAATPQKSSPRRSEISCRSGKAQRCFRGE